MLAELLAEGDALAGIGRGDVVRPVGRTQPAHAVAEPRRGEPHLGVAEALADLAQHRVGRQAQVLDLDHGMAAGEARIDGIERALDPDRGVGQVDQEERGVAGHRPVLHLGHDDRPARAVGAGDQPLLAVDHPFVAVLPCRGF